MNDQLKAAIIAFVNAVFPFLVLVGVLDWDANTIAAAMLVVTTFMTVVGLVWALRKPAPAPAAEPMPSTPVTPPK